MCLLLTSAQSVFFLYLTPIYAQRISLRGTIVAALLLFSPCFCFFGAAVNGTESAENICLSSSLLTLMPIGPNIPTKAAVVLRCPPPFASRVITYHQSKLIIADWVGVVNDYRRGRTGAVSLAPFCSQWWTWQKGRRAWRERGRGGEEGGGATRLFGLHWETTASQDGQKVRGWIRKWSVIWGRWMSPQGNTPFSFLLYCRW